MANTTLTNLPTVTSLNGSEPLLGVQAGVSVQITTGQIASLAAGTSGSPFSVSAGGTGQSSFTQYALIYGDGTAPLGETAVGTTGQVFVGNTGGAPTWSSTIPASAGVTSINFGSTGLTPSGSTTGAVSVAGTLVAANGGTGQSSYTIGDILFASGTTTLSKLADVATGNALISGGVGVAPSYGKIGLTTHVSGILPVANGGTGQSSALTQYGLIYGDSTTAMASTAAGTTGQVLIGNTGAAPSWSAATSVAVTSISFGSTGLTPNTATQGAITVAGTLATGYGGTGLTTFTAANNAIYSTSASALTAGTLPVAAGGTGATTLTLNGVLYGNGTSAVQALAQAASGTVLTGTGAAPAFSATPTVTTLNATTVVATAGAGFQNMVVLTSGASWSLPAALQVTGAKFKITVIGGGGAGGGNPATAATAGAGGGAGGVAVAYLTYVAGQNSVTTSFGAAGAGSSGAVGGNGGATTATYNSLTYIGTGGTGGALGAATSAGGAGGTGSTGTGTVTLALTGQTGGAGGTTTAVAGVTYLNNKGGDTALGFGQGGLMPFNAATGVAGNAGINYGAGGSGSVAGSTATARAGGNGTAGAIIIEY